MPINFRSLSVSREYHRSAVAVLGDRVRRSETLSITNVIWNDDALSILYPRDQRDRSFWLTDNWPVWKIARRPCPSRSQSQRKEKKEGKARWRPWMRSYGYAPITLHDTRRRRCKNSDRACRNVHRTVHRPRFLKRAFEIHLRSIAP